MVTRREQAVERVARLIYERLTYGQTSAPFTLDDARRVNDGQGWSLDTRSDRDGRGADAGATGGEGIRLSDEELDQAWNLAQSSIAGESAGPPSG